MKITSYGVNLDAVSSLDYIATRLSIPITFSSVPPSATWLSKMAQILSFLLSPGPPGRLSVSAGAGADKPAHAQALACWTSSLMTLEERLHHSVSLYVPFVGSWEQGGR